MDLKRTMLWSATLGSASFEDRVRAAVETGHPNLSVSPDDVQRAIDKGQQPLAQRRWAADLGVGLPLMEGFGDWYPHPEPKRSVMPPYDLDTFLHLAATFQVETVLAVSAFPTDVGMDRVTEGFAQFCDRAALHGIAVALEFTPVPPVDSVRVAHKVVQDAGRPNATIVFDTWHFFQGDPDFKALEEVPVGMISKTQICDGHAGVFREDLIRDTLRNRLLPGHGSFDLTRLLPILERLGALDSCGPEVPSTELFALSPSDAAAAVAKAYDDLADRCRTA